MSNPLDAWTERFERALHTTMHNLGPELIKRAQTDLTPGQCFMMYFIREQDHCTVSSLSEKMEVNPSAVTVMLDRLENHGYVSRSRDREDRRVVIAELTEAGEQALDAVMNMRKRVVQHCLGQLSPDELESFLTTLEKVASVSASMDVKTILCTSKDMEE
jgi:DNA-binding MarR family transcriptional regulator